MREYDLTYRILQCAYKVHSELGPGLLKSSYQFALNYELISEGFIVQSQKSLPLKYCGQVLEIAYRIDLIVNNQIIIEIKSVDELNDVHTAQLLTYLKLANKRLGLLLNFNVASLKHGVRKLINDPKTL